MPLLTLRLRYISRRSILRSAVAIVIALGLLALLFSRFYTATHTIVTIEHQQKSLTGQLVGHPAPDFTITLWNGTPGEKIHLAALHGRVVVLNFWAAWCDPCHDEAGVLAGVAQSNTQSHATNSVVFLGIALETEDTDGQQFLRQYHVPYDCGPAPDSVAVAYALTGIPVTVTINAKGVVVGQIDGPVTTASLDSAIHTALG